MVFYLSLSDSKSSQVSRTLLNILVDFIWAVVWMLSTLPIIPILSCFFFLSKFLGYYSEGSINDWYHRHLYISQIFCFLARSKYFFRFSPSFTFVLWSAGTAKFTTWQILFFLLWSSWGDLSLSQSPRELHAFYFQRQILVSAFTVCA